MDGIEQAEYSTVQIVFPEFYVHPEFAAYDKDKPLAAKDIVWQVECDFDIKKPDENLNHLTVYATLTLERKKDAVKIAQLSVESTFKIPHHLQFRMKYVLLCHLINQTFGHAQGGWRMKHKNVVLFDLLPQPFDKQETMELTLKKRLYEEWI